MFLRCLFALTVLCHLAKGESPALKIMSWNIHRAQGMDEKLDLPRVAEVIKAQNPDVVVLQEVDQKTTRSQGIDQAKELGRLIGFQAVFGDAMPFQGGFYGQALLSKHPIESHQVLRLSAREKSEPRIGISARILHPSGPVTVAGVHLEYRQVDWRLSECTELEKAVGTVTGPVVVAGDFNALPDCPSLVPLKPAWQRVIFPAPTGTWPADKPETEIDHIYFRGLLPPKETAIIAETVASDHRPIVATFAFPKP